MSNRPLNVEELVRLIRMRMPGFFESFELVYDLYRCARAKMEARVVKDLRAITDEDRKVRSPLEILQARQTHRCGTKKNKSKLIAS